MGKKPSRLLVTSGVDRLAFLLRLADPLALILSSYIAYLLRVGGGPTASGYIGLTLIGIVAYGLFGHMAAIYRTSNVGRPLVGVPRMLSALFGAMGFIVVILFLTKTSAVYSRAWLILWVITSSICLLALRSLVSIIITRAIRQKRWQQRVAILGSGEKSAEIVRILTKTEVFNTVLTAIYCEKNEPDDIDLRHHPLFKGGLKHMMQDGRHGIFDVLIVTMDLDRVPHAKKTFTLMRNLNVSIYHCLPRALFGIVSGAMPTLESVPLVMVMRKPIEGHNLLLKRTLDILVSGAALLPILPFPQHA